MEISKTGIELIKSFESLRLKAYKAHTGEKYYTIGYGHYSSNVQPNDTITKEEAEELLAQDLIRFVKHVNKYNNKYKFNQNEFNSLVSFAYNVGSIDKLTASGTRSRAEIADAFPKYCKSGGVKLDGLVRRRASELKLFLTPVSHNSALEFRVVQNYVVRELPHTGRIIGHTNIDGEFATANITEVELLPTVGNWLKIKNKNGSEGYISAKAVLGRFLVG